MPGIESRTAKSEEALRDRILSLVKTRSRLDHSVEQSSLPFQPGRSDVKGIEIPTSSAYDFLQFLCAAVPKGEVYLFGGVLRDLALLGSRRFSSDIDIVVEGMWKDVARYLDSVGATKNRFGGYRLDVGNVPIDVWNAEETWAIRNGLVKYRNIASLTETTILNWDAILLEWRTGSIICRRDYFPHIRERVMDIVLEKNPNPMGAAIRVFRHFCRSDAQAITMRVARYLGRAVQKFSKEDMLKAEQLAYKERRIYPPVLDFFRSLDTGSDSAIRDYFLSAWDQSLVSEVRESEQLKLL